MSDSKLYIRPVSDNEEERNFVFASYKASTFDSNQFITRREHKDFREKVLVSLLRKGAKLCIVSLLEKPDIFIGWILYEPFGDNALIHYVYVKKALRKKGVAKGLLNYLGVNLKQPINITHTSKPLVSISRFHSYKFNNRPNLLFSGEFI